MNKNAVTHKSKTGVIAAVAIVLTILLCAVAGRAFAQTGHYVDGWEDTGVSNAYLDKILPDEWDITFHNSNFYTLDTDDGYKLIACKGGVQKGKTVSAPNALTLTAKNGAYTVDGRYLDVEFDFSFTFYGYKGTNSDMSAMRILENNRYLWTYGTYIVDGNTSKMTDEIACSVDTTLKITYSDTGEAYNGGLQSCFEDLDVIADENLLEYREAIKIESGFAEDVYVAKDTLLDKDELENSNFTHFVAGAVDSDTFRSGVALFTQGSVSTYNWKGLACGTGFLVFYPNYPQDYVTSVDQTVAKDKVTLGETVAFDITQAYPYVQDSNMAAKIVVADTLDSALDATNATVKVFANGVDVTSNWTVTKSGQTLTLTAKDTREVQGDYTFTVAAPLRMDTDFSDYERDGDYFLIPNTVQSAVNGDTYTANDVAAEVYRFGDMVLNAASDNADVTDGNALYSVDGAQYAVYTDKDCMNQIAALVIEDGSAALSRLEPGTYYIKQVSPGEGYSADDNVYSFDMQATLTSVVDVTLSPITDPVETIVMKYDAELGLAA